MALHWSLPFIEACVTPEISANLPSTQTHPWADHDSTETAYIPLVNGLTGDLMAKMPMPSGRRVSRGKLRNLLTTGIDIHFGMELSEVLSECNAGGKPTATALFNGGSVVAKGSVVVGADGGSFCFSFLIILPRLLMENLTIHFYFYSKKCGPKSPRE